VVSCCKEEARVCSQLYFAGYAHKSDVRAVLKMVEEFLKPCGDSSRLTVVVPLTGGVLPLESKDGLAHKYQLDIEKCIF
jgi:hypothetical protein